MNYDSLLFVEIIESVKGVQHLRNDQDGDVKVRFYQGINGKLVIIDVSDEYITDDDGKGYLAQLGLEYLISGMFPTSKKTAIEEAKAILQENTDSEKSSE
jgi:hypothetical protein